MSIQRCISGRAAGKAFSAQPVRSFRHWQLRDALRESKPAKLQRDRFAGFRGSKATRRMAAVERTDRIREAKVFLASRITEEAERQGAPLSETERKMLYFSPTGWTLEDMATVKEAF